MVPQTERKVLKQIHCIYVLKCIAVNCVCNFKCLKIHFFGYEVVKGGLDNILHLLVVLL